MAIDPQIQAVLDGTSRWCVVHGEARDVLPSIPSGSVHFACFDPPYSAHVHGSVRRGIGANLTDSAGRMSPCADKRNTDLGFVHLTPRDRTLMARECARLASRWSLAFSDIEGAAWWRMSFQAAGLEYVRTLVWDKIGSTPQFTGDRPATAVEAMTLVHPSGRKRWNGGGRRGIYSVPIALNRGDGRDERVHTTQKPEKLMEAVVSDFSDTDEIVLDMTAGSGTTGVAALRLGRRVILVERIAAYADVARARLAAEQDDVDARRSHTSHAARKARQLPMFGVAK